MEKIILKKLYGEDKKAVVGKILVKAGDELKVGDPLFNAESTKGNYLVKSEYVGKIAEVLIEEGQEIKVGDQIALIDGALETGAPPKSGGYSFGLAKPKKEEIECDIVVIGGGPGGYVAAIRAAQLGASVVVIEENKIGGTCLNTGCIPTKSFVASAHLMDKMRECDKFGLRADGLEVVLKEIVERKDGVVNNLASGIKYLFERWNIRYIEGHAHVEKAGVSVKNAKLEALVKSRKTILATGSNPCRLPLPGVDLPVVMTNEEILAQTEMPESLTVIGGGVIGMEFAFIFSSFGCKVTVLECKETILASLDVDVIELMENACKKKGIKIFTGATVLDITMAENDQAIVGFETDGNKRFVVSDKVLMSVGRRANIDSVDLKMLEVELNSNGNGIAVDKQMRTSNENVYAIGDVTNIIPLAHVASHQGIVAAQNCMGIDSVMDYSVIPSAIFTSPEIGVIGMCERKATQAGLIYGVSKFPFAANGKALSQGESEGFVKILYLEDEKRIIGASIVGPGATDLISVLASDIKNKTDYRKLQHTIFAHPTTAESVHEAILGITGESIHYG